MGLPKKQKKLGGVAENLKKSGGGRVVCEKNQGGGM